ncbi:MAG: antibiotic biosynthesis monooxygenase [Subtercola sp.]|nr:antibiotic biosynthesis monooxygenase [Subtercola sp.]
MTVTAYLDVHLVPERAAEAYPIVHDTLVATRAFAGNVSVDVWIDDADPAHLVYVERWLSHEAVDSYRAWRRGEGASTEMVPFLAGPPVMTFVTLATDI